MAYFLKDHTSGLSESNFDHTHRQKAIFMKQFTWQLMCENLKKAFKIKFYTFPAHFSAPVKVTYDFYSCFPQFSATHACCPQLSAPPRSTSAHQRGLERWSVAESCGKGAVLRRTAEKMAGAAEKTAGAAETSSGVADKMPVC